MTSERAPFARSRSPRVAIVGVVASLAAVVFIMAVNVVFLLNGLIGETAFSLIPTLLIVDMSVVGGLLAIRRPANAIGSVLLGAGLLVAVSFAAGYYANLDDLMGQGRLPFVVPVAWIGTWTCRPSG